MSTSARVTPKPLGNTESYDSSSGEKPINNSPGLRGYAPVDDKNIPNYNDEDNTPTIK